MSELKPCPFCGENVEVYKMTRLLGQDHPGFVRCDCVEGVSVARWNDRPIEDALRAELEKRTAELHYANTACMEMKHELDRLNAEIKTTGDLLKESTETIGAVVACCTYNSNDDAKIGIYGIDQKAFTMIDQFITHYNDTVSAGKVSVDVKTSTDNNKCMWVMVEDPDIDLWCTSCGEEFHLEADTPSDNHMKYCCYCGKEISEG